MKVDGKRVAIGAAIVIVAGLVIFLIYPDGLITIGNAFNEFHHMLGF